MLNRNFCVLKNADIVILLDILLSPANMQWQSAEACCKKHMKSGTVPHPLCSHRHALRLAMSAASIWFEIWGSWIRVKKCRFSRKISEKFRFFQAISQTKKSIFQGKFPKNFGSFQVISQKISIFQVKFSKNFNFFKQFPKIFRFLGKFPKKPIFRSEERRVG